MKSLNRRKKYLWIYGVFCAAVMILIFLFSSQDSDASSKVSKKVLDWVEESKASVVTPKISFDVKEKSGFKFNLNGRKWGHFYLYALLGAVQCLWWREFFRGKKLRMPKAFLSAAGVCLAYACSDEFHQRFVPGRGSDLKDVLYDSCGYGLSILLVTLAAEAVGFVLRRLKHNEDRYSGV